MTLSISLNTFAAKQWNAETNIESVLAPYFNTYEREKAAEYIGTDRIHIIHDTDLLLMAEVEGNHDNYLLNFSFEFPPAREWRKFELKDFRLKADCACPAYVKNNLCKHIWALAKEAELTDFSANFSLTMEKGLWFYNDEIQKPSIGNSWKQFIPKSRQYSDGTLRQHQILQANLINKPTPRKYFLTLREPRDQLKEHRALHVVYRTVKKAGVLGPHQVTYISASRLNDYPDPNFTVIAKEIINLRSIDIKKNPNEYYDPEFRYHYGYDYRDRVNENSSIDKVSIKPFYFDLIRLSGKMGRLCIESANKSSKVSKPELETLFCDENTWQIKFKLSNKLKSPRSKDNKSDIFQLSAYLVNAEDSSEILEKDSQNWKLNVPSQTILAGNMLMFIKDVSLPELAIALINSRKKIEVSKSEINDFLVSLAENGHLNYFDIPEELISNIARKAPRPVLMLEYPGKNNENPIDLCGLISFDYESESITPNDKRRWIESPELAPGGQNIIIERDFERERELLAPFADFVPGVQSSDIHGLAAVSIPLSDIFSLVERLLIAGWEVRLARQLIKKSSSNSVAIASGIDWFEITSEINFDGEVVQLDKLIHAAKDRQNFITFNNGQSLGIIPPELIRRINALSQLGSIKDGKIRLNSNQAVWIDLLLSEEIADRNDLDERIKFARASLSGISGIQPSEPSRAFKGNLREYQKFGLGWLKAISLSGFGACLADDMGLGKTVQILGLLDSVLGEKKLNVEKSKDKMIASQPSLIVAPKTLIENWLRECEKFTPQLKAVAYHGLSRKELKDDLRSYDLILTTYATLVRDIGELKDCQFNFVILDEAQAIKNASSLSAKSCLLLKAKYRLALTGTPIENSLDDLLSIFEFLNPGMLGQMARKSSNLSKNGNMPTEGMQYISKGLLPFILRRAKSEVLKELPPKTEQVLYCELTPRQQKLYDKTKEHYKASLSKEIREKGVLSVKMQFLEALLRLRQICCDPRLIDPKLETEDSTKLVTLLEELAELKAAGKKALVFSQFTSFLKLVGDELKSRNIDFDYLDGKTNQRQALVDKFQNHQGSRFFLISIKAGGVGLNLTSAEYCFILDPWWNPAIEAQAIDRAHRIGQANPVFAYKLIAKNSVEEKIISLQQDKKEIAELFTSENSGFIKNLTVKDFEMIFD